VEIRYPRGINDLLTGEIGRDQGTVGLENGHGATAVVVGAWSRQEWPHIGAVEWTSVDNEVAHLDGIIKHLSW
jgi:hypothetical protein